MFKIDKESNSYQMYKLISMWSATKGFKYSVAGLAAAGTAVGLDQLFMGRFKLVKLIAVTGTGTLSAALAAHFEPEVAKIVEEYIDNRTDNINKLLEIIDTLVQKEEEAEAEEAGTPNEEGEALAN